VIALRATEFLSPFAACRSSRAHHFVRNDEFWLDFGLRLDCVFNRKRCISAGKKFASWGFALKRNPSCWFSLFFEQCAQHWRPHSHCIPFRLQNVRDNACGRCRNVLS
jgi:hypothetical protein